MPGASLPLPYIERVRKLLGELEVTPCLLRPLQCCPLPRSCPSTNTLQIPSIPGRVRPSQWAVLSTQPRTKGGPMAQKTGANLIIVVPPNSCYNQTLKGTPFRGKVDFIKMNLEPLRNVFFLFNKMNPTPSLE